MQTAQEFYAAVNNANLDLGLASAEASQAAGEGLVRFQLETCKGLLHALVQQVREAVAVKDPGELLALSSKWSQDSTEKLMSQSRNYVSTAQEANQQIARFLVDSGTALQGELVKTIEKVVSQSALPGGQSALAAMKVAMASASKAMDAMDQATKQFTEYAGASLTASPMGAAAKAASPRKRAS